MRDYEQKAVAELRTCGAECTVLLKSNGDFPLDGPCRIAAYGSGVRRTIKGGTGSGEVNSRFYVTVEEGLEEAGFTLTSKSWLDAYDRVYAQAKSAFHREVRERAREKHTMAVMEGMGAVMAEPDYELPLEVDGDTAVYVLSRISGEGSDRRPIKGDLYLTDSECRDILFLQNHFKRFLLVLNVGGPVDLSAVADSVDNILVLSQLGVVTGNILADLLLGRANPSGKLTTTWADWEDYSSYGSFGEKDETRYREGIYVGYRYFDTVGKRARFPFGFGLSYTTFRLSFTGVAVAGEAITVSLQVENTGTRSGKEVVQLYVSVPQQTLDQPYQTLAAFAKTDELRAKETQSMALCFSMRDLASYDERQACYVLEAGDYILRMGCSSTETRPVGVVRVKQECKVLQSKNCLGTTDFTDWKPTAEERVTSEDDLSGVHVIELPDAALEEKQVDYDRATEVADEVRVLSDEAAAYLTVGAFDAKGIISSVIGNSAISVAGAAGETTDRLKEKGFPTIVMADGPAGLRLCRQFVRDKTGVHGLGPALPETMMEYMPRVAGSLIKLLETKPKKGQEIQEQYCTAIPIGTAVAQSWNVDLAERLGDLVGKEMERFGVHLWLAPALNIHRSILCGRNFEYCSEDPLISGRISAAITRGVQKHDGCGTTIKHYAANNQETNRYRNNSQVSERALREIYLRGFGICIRESQPKAVMTSYNLLNGIHTAEHGGLIRDVLRCEYGYQGLVMTDWIMTMAGDKESLHGDPDAAKIVAAGGDLVMPGSKADHQSIVRAVQNGSLSRDTLNDRATRVYRAAKAFHGNNA